MAQATDSLAKWRNNIYIISQMIQNDVSSTKIRLFLRRGLSVRYLLPAAVIDYIEAHGLYLDEGPNSGNAQYMEQLHKERDALQQAQQTQAQQLDLNADCAESSTRDKRPVD